jgi:hypothetical protein
MRSGEPSLIASPGITAVIIIIAIVPVVIVTGGGGWGGVGGHGGWAGHSGRSDVERAGFGLNIDLEAFDSGDI